ncbi:MAG: pyrimidine-nucleoside phosphorylase [Halanaerobiales bacterium]|nr:pyrimidine-nucleoside phosphorylase [Halanaerobiales bacterium]
MRAYDLIHKKRVGEQLSAAEIRFLVEGYTAGEIPDYQISAWLMAIFFQGMDAQETAELTMAMVESGERLDLSPIPGVKIDKHSTGGVGDTTTLVLAPLVAAAGVPVAKMSGRSLGHTGGTIDKLEAIPGFKTELTLVEFINNVNSIGVAIAGQTGNLTPADKKLYALRDVTATVDSIPLIASSVMSKKIAAGCEGIVLDVKSGEGAFLKSLEQSRQLARAMVAIGQEVGRRVMAVLTDMNQPLGWAIGNALEVKEAIKTLQGNGPPDLEDLCLTLGANMLWLAGRVSAYEQGYRLLKDLLESGKALEQFGKLITAQGGDGRIVEDLNLLPIAQHIVAVRSEQSGYISSITASQIGLTAMAIGAGRSTKEDVIDPSVGVVLNKKVGQPVEKGEPLAFIHLNKQTGQEQALAGVANSFRISDEQPEQRGLIYDIIS